MISETDEPVSIKPEVPTIMAVGGSDPSGGAGIQADLKTLTMLGEYGAAVITAITVQNSHGVEHIEPLSPSLVSRQIEAVLADHWVTHIKIGMVGTGAIARSVGESLSDFRGEIIYDPVLAASTGQSLLMDDGMEMINKHLLQVVTVLTPNLPELNRLTQKTRETAVEELFRQNPNLNCIIVKGGHGRVNNNLLTDTCFIGDIDNKVTACHKYIHSRNSHGTGCTMASAFAAYHSKTNDYSQSFTSSSNFVERLLIRSSTKTVVLNPAGKGPMLHMDNR
jgi:hydroxymethylpyrimidine/phosphomethylpyrimidine kinase